MRKNYRLHFLQVVAKYVLGAVGLIRKTSLKSVNPNPFKNLIQVNLLNLNFKIFIAIIWLLNIDILAQAESKKLIYEGARQGTEWAVYLLNKKLVKKVELGGETRRLYLVNLEINNSYDGVTKQTNLIQCSTSQPFVAFKSDYEQQMAIIHFINPGEEFYGYNSGSHWTYWAVCHDLWQPWEYKLDLKASQFGYSGQLESNQIEIPYGLLQYLK